MFDNGVSFMLNTPSSFTGELNTFTFCASSPPGAIVVMEDIDVSMPNSDGLRMNRDDEYDVEKVGGDESRNPKGGSSPGGARASGVTLSGLLNAIVNSFPLGAPCKDLC